MHLTSLSILSFLMSLLSLTCEHIENPGTQRAAVMYLINVRTLTLEEFGSERPPYAILSHTWDVEEVSFADFHNTSKRNGLKGFTKIKQACEQASADRLEYAWVDTCCINKDSSAELSESINSMFKWYSDAAVCYAFLIDLPEDVKLPITDSNVLARCKWFSRGWTLQELLAPREIVFFNTAWKKVNRSQLQLVLGQVTGIPDDILSKKKKLADVSVADRMRWASRRQTKREEDIAYCLLGIFDVNMPMVYGEGKKAFIRLQEEIVRNIQDDTLFAWEATGESALEAPFRGLFASSPAEFAHVGGLTPFHPSIAGSTNIVGSGRIVLNCSLHDRISGQSVVGLKCLRTGDLSKAVGINVVRAENNIWLRSNPSNTLLCAHGPRRDLNFQRHVEKRQAQLLNDAFLNRGVRLAALPRGVSLSAVNGHQQYSAWDPALVYPISDIFGGIMFEITVSDSGWDMVESVYLGVWPESAVDNTYRLTLSKKRRTSETDRLLDIRQDTQQAAHGIVGSFYRLWVSEEDETVGGSKILALTVNCDVVARRFGKECEVKSAIVGVLFVYFLFAVWLLRTFP